MNVEIPLVGTKLSHRWTEVAEQHEPGSFVTLFCRDDTLVWNDTSNPDDVRSGREAYVRTDLAPGIVQVSWKQSPEVDEVGVVWTLNFETNRIHGVVIRTGANDNELSAGEFEQSDDMTVDISAGLQDCAPPRWA